MSSAAPTPDMSTLSLHDALPIYRRARRVVPGRLAVRLHEVRVPARHLVQRVERLLLEVDVLAGGGRAERLVGGDAVEPVDALVRSEEHTSELQSRGQPVCRLLLE